MYYSGSCPNIVTLQILSGSSIKNESQQELQISPLGITAYKFSQDISHRDLAHMIVIHVYPFHIVEHKGSLKFVNNLRPQFKVMCDKTTRKDCKDYITDLRKKLI